MLIDRATRPFMIREDKENENKSTIKISELTIIGYHLIVFTWRLRVKNEGGGIERGNDGWTIKIDVRFNPCL